MNIFITGGTSGIGLELAKLYLSRGDHVGLCGRNEDKLRSAYPEGFPQKLTFYQVDIAKKEEIHAAVHAFANAQGKIDTIIANAGISAKKDLEIPNFETARKIVDTNIVGTINTIEIAVATLLKNETKPKGQIVVIGSVAGFLGLPRAGAYSASKGFLMKYCQSMAIDLKHFGIDTTYIAPGFIRTPLTGANNFPMPFIMSAERAAKLIAHAIDKRKLMYVFPWQMKMVMKLLRAIPYSIYIRLMRRLNKP